MTATLVPLKYRAQLPQGIDAVRRFLAETESVADIARLHDLAEAARRYADSHEAQNYAAEVKLRCARRAGELLTAEVLAGNRFTGSTLQPLGVDKFSSSRWQRMATVPAGQFETYLTETDEVTAAGLLRLAKVERRSRRDADLPAPTANGEQATKTYATLVADPPWRYGNTATRGAAADHYPTMTVEELGRLSVEVDEWAAPDSHLYLWATNNFLREAFEVVEAWGFDYKTLLTWVKPQIGMGNYFRAPGMSMSVPGPAIVCCVCRRPVAHPAWPDAWCWSDPAGTVCAAHGDCLRNLGETDLGLKDAS